VGEGLEPGALKGKVEKRSRRTNGKQDREHMSTSREQGNSRRAMKASGGRWRSTAHKRDVQMLH